jgi:YYY domain-containing protein
MRYQLPIYPLLAMMAAWLVVQGGKRETRGARKGFFLFRSQTLLAILGILVLLLTAGWAFAFTSIYTRDEPRIAASKWIYENVPAPLNLHLVLPDGSLDKEPLPFYSGVTVQQEVPYRTVFLARQDGVLNSVSFAHLADLSASGTQTLTLVVATDPEPTGDEILATAIGMLNFSESRDQSGDPYFLNFDPPLAIQEGQTYYLVLETSGGSLAISGSGVINETDYDWTLPFRIDGYDGFGGLFRGDLNLQIYWPDNADKLERYLDTLNDGDFIFIPTNHQYAQTTRIPERYPLTTAYYRALVGCPDDQDIIRCYRLAEPGMFTGQLGYDLVATFTAYPTLGPIVINDQAAEEAFTFYDHPKVLIFQKSAEYDPDRVAAILGAVDLGAVVQLLPGQADDYKDLMLSEADSAIQQAGGTWSELFNRDSLLNRFPGLGLVVWYLLILAVGVFAYPLVRAALPGLADGGYPLARVVGLLLWAWLVWMAGSNGIPFNKLTIGISLGIVACLGAWQAWRQRASLKEECGSRWKFFLFLELLFLAFFLFDLLIRIGNPDLWHPSKGGERPMNFAQLNAVLRSTVFPPYDAWYSGGYINYYYFGDVIVGTPVKLLGIVPSIAFNFILPTLFAIMGLGTFSIGYNLIKPRLKDAEHWSWKNEKLPLVAGFCSTTAVLLLGNLGVVRLFILGFQQNGAPAGIIDGGSLFEKTWWTLKGFFLTLVGQPLPYGPGEWYWFASRIFAFPHDEFYEFPAFTFLWSDLHAHLIAYMLTIVVIAWVISLLFARGRWGNRLDAVLGLLLGALVIGSLKPANTWDFYTYLVFGLVGLFYVLARFVDLRYLSPALPGWLKRLALAVAGVAVLAGISLLLYQPFSRWFGQAYSSINLWKGMRTPLVTYLVQWSILLFFIVSWMAWETRQWLAETPLSAVQKLRPFRDLILFGLAVVLLVLIFQQVWVMLPNNTPPWNKITVPWLAIPLALWAAILLVFRPGLAEQKRLVLFMTGTGLLLTILVEFFVVAGDVGRMNTVYKFGVQSWVMLGFSAAASFAWLLPEFRKWLPAWKWAWQALATLLVVGGALFLLVAGVSKVRDRWILEAPRTLDSMGYMQYATYSEFGRTFSTAEDYQAILWLQENVSGSPVIVEAAPAGVQYTWLSRISIYTGLPSVVGWQWHEQQQRVYFSSQVIQRGIDVDNFYRTTDAYTAVDFLQKYDVRYIILGQLELGKYTPTDPLVASGLPKFEQFNGALWNEVFREGETVIYEVVPGIVPAREDMP